MILEWNSVAKREFPLEWKTEWLVRERNVVSIIVLVPRGPRSFWTAFLMKTDTVAFPEVSVLERVDCVFLLMTYTTHCRHRYLWKKQTKEKPSSEWVSTQQPQTVRLVFLDHTKVRQPQRKLKLEHELNCPIDRNHEPLVSKRSPGTFPYLWFLII